MVEGLLALWRLKQEDPEFEASEKLLFLFICDSMCYTKINQG